MKDPLSIHRKSSIPPPAAGDDELIKTAVKSLPYDLETEFTDDSGLVRFASPSSTSASSSSKSPVVQIEMDAYEAEDAETEDTCANVCGVTRVEGAKSEQEALCSPAGLKATCKIYSHPDALQLMTVRG